MGVRRHVRRVCVVTKDGLVSRVDRGDGMCDVGLTIGGTAGSEKRFHQLVQGYMWFDNSLVIIT